MISKIKKIFLILLLGQVHSRPTNKLRPAIANQWLNVKRVWNNEHYNDFGIERLVRLTLALSSFIFPGLYIRAFFGRLGLLGRKLAVDLYVVLKLALPVIFFKLNLTCYPIVAVISAIMGIETIIYLAALIFLSNEFARPISYRRSLTAVFINYVEICLNYAVIYSYFNLIIPDFFNQKLTTDMQAIYFSFVTSATVGYGDIFPKHHIGQTLVVSQIIIFLFFVGLFITFFASKVQDPTYYNEKPTYNDKWQTSKMAKASYRPNER